MAERKYTVDEIIVMRTAAQFILSRSPVPMSAAATEDHLRTYMANGTEPEELEEVVKRTLEVENPGFDTSPGAINRVR